MPESSDNIEVDLTGKTVLVTGASGLGAHFAKVLARAGASVIVGARRLEALAVLAREIANEGGNAAPSPST